MHLLVRNVIGTGISNAHKTDNCIMNLNSFYEIFGKKRNTLPFSDLEKYYSVGSCQFIVEA